MNEKKKLIEHFKQVARKCNAALARCKELSARYPGPDYKLEEHQAAWRRYCELRTELWKIKMQYKGIKLFKY